MSAVADDPIQAINLNSQQVDAIIDYALKAGMYEGTAPSDPELKRTDAATLVYQARRARDNGNKNPHVTEICFIADSDQAVNNVPDPSQVDSAAAFAPGSEQQASPPAQTNGADADLASLSDEQLAQIIEALKPNESIPTVRQEIERHRAEQIRRQSAAPSPQAQVPPPTPPPAVAPQPPQVPTGEAATPIPPPPAGQQLPAGDRDADGQPRPRVDAPAVAVPEAPQPGQEGQLPAAQAATEDGRRAEILRQVTYGVLEAYGKTFQDLDQMPTEDIERMLAAPGGVVQQPATASITPERAKLEEQVTGPMLKAWKRGRAQIVELSDDELREMIDYPAGPTTRPQGQAFTDGQPPMPIPPVQPEVVTTPEVNEQVAAAGVPSQQVQSAGEDRAMAVIAREHLQGPPDVADPPTIPADISKLSDEDLRSIHGRHHAVEARLNWVISQHEDEVDDHKRLRNVRDAEVRNAPREGKKPTKDEWEAIVNADQQIREIDEKISEAEKVLRKLKVLRDNAHLTCQRCSREWSMRYLESEGSKRGTP